jgi:imidazolonepropionase-like amidohydrolase
LALALVLSIPATNLQAQARMVDTTPPTTITAITGGKLLTVTHGTIENGVILLQSGKISAVGTAAIKIPKGATIVDAHGMTVYPGLIAAETTLGLSEVESDDVNSDLVETSEEIFPQMHVYDAFHAETERIPIARFNGITNAVVAPAGEDTMPGQDIFIQLAGLDRDAMILARDTALSMNFGNDPKRRGKYPSTRMGEISQLHQALIDATEYMHKKDAAAAAKAEPEKDAKDAKDDKEKKEHKHEPPKFSLRDEALIPYLKGEKPVVIGVDEGHDIEAIMALANEFHLKVVLDHVTRSQGVLDKVASYHVPVMIGSIYELPRANERFDSVYTLPGELAKRGVKIVLLPGDAGGPGGGQALRNLPYVAGMAVAYGLPYDEALKSITLNPAEVFGMGATLGSLDVGKTANIVIANGDPLDVRTTVKQVYIDGVAIPMETRQTRLRDEYTPKK